MVLAQGIMKLTVKMWARAVVSWSWRIHFQVLFLWLLALCLSFFPCGSLHEWPHTTTPWLLPEQLIPEMGGRARRKATVPFKT